MKLKNDPRHIKRQQIIKQLFSWAFNSQTALNNSTRNIISNLKKVDTIIRNNARLWPIEQISKIDLVILRLAVFELIVDQTQPKKVIIDEAIELAKEYGGETSPSFVNGVLGSVVKENYGRKN